MSCIKKTILILGVVLSLNAGAAGGRVATYDLGISSGTYNNNAYSEINFGLSLRLLEHLVWRNNAFMRLQENSSTAGVDTSMRYVYDDEIEKGGLGFGLFAGPGYRFSKKELSGPFVEGGMMLKGSGFGVGLGAKSIFYTAPTKYANGDEAPKNDTVIFIILAVGGGF